MGKKERIKGGREGLMDERIKYVKWGIYLVSNKKE